MKNQVCITTVTLSILETSLDQFCVFKAGSVLLILGSILPFCIGLGITLAPGSLLRPYKALIKSIEKKGRNQRFVKNCRPNSLLNVDVRIASKVLE